MRAAARWASRGRWWALLRGLRSFCEWEVRAGWGVLASEVGVRKKTHEVLCGLEGGGRVGCMDTCYCEFGIWMVFWAFWKDSAHLVSHMTEVWGGCV